MWKAAEDYNRQSYLVENLIEPKLTQNRLKLTRIHPQLILQGLKRFGDQKFSSFIWKLAKDFYQASYLVENLMEPKLTQNRLKLTRIHPPLILQSLKRFGDHKFSSFIWTMKPKISTKLLIWLKISWSPNWLKIGSNWPEYIPHWSYKVWKDLETISFQASFEQWSQRFLLSFLFGWKSHGAQIDSK